MWLHVAVESGWERMVEAREHCLAELALDPGIRLGDRCQADPVPRFDVVSVERQRALHQLTQASAGLLFMSETDVGFSPIDAPGVPFSTLDADAVRALAGRQGSDEVETISVDSLFRNAVLDQPWHTPKERDDARRYRELVALIKSLLPDARVYRVGQISIDVLIVGSGPGGGVLGLRTRVVET